MCRVTLSVWRALSRSVSAVDSPHLILFEFFIKIPSPVTRALCFLTCLYILCARLCAHVNGSVSACLQRGNRQSFSVKCNKVSAALHASVRNRMSPIYFYCNISLISKYCPSQRSVRVYWGIPDSGLDIQLQTPLSPSAFCSGDPDVALNAGHCRLLTKLGERGVLWACLKEVHTIKNSLPSCQCIAIKNSWAGLLPAFSHVKVDSLIVRRSCHNSPFTATLCWLLCASTITEAKSAS